MHIQPDPSIDTGRLAHQAEEASSTVLAQPWIGLINSFQLTGILLVIWLNHVQQRGASWTNDWALYITTAVLLISGSILAGLVLSWRRPARL